LQQKPSKVNLTRRGLTNVIFETDLKNDVDAIYHSHSWIVCLNLIV
jgi:hypothetical protein